MSFVATRKPTSRYRAPAHRSLPPLPPQWIHEVRAIPRQPGFWRFVFLSMLLHLLFITLFGAPSGGSREGRAVWGSSSPFQVTLAPRRSEPAPAPVPKDEGPQAFAAERAYVFPQLLDRIVVPEQRTPPPLLVPPPSGIEAAPPPSVAVPAPLPKVERRAAEKALASVPIVEPAPPPVIATPAIPAAERRPMVEAPLVPAPMVRPAPPPAVATPVIPRVEREVTEARPLLDAPKLEAPVVPAPGPPVEVAAPRVEPKVEPVARPIERALTQEIETPPTKPPTALERALSRDLSPSVKIEGDAPAPGPAPPIASPFRRSLPAPPEPRGDYDPTAPAQNLDPEALRQRAGQIARGTGNRALLPFAMPPVDPPKSKMETAIEKARKPDCRDAYKDLGLAAIVPLIANEFGEGKCRW